MSVIDRHLHIRDVEAFLDALEASIKRKLTVDEWERARTMHAEHHFNEIKRKKS